MITFTADYGSYKVTVTTEHPSATDVVEAFKAFLLAAGFQPDTVSSVQDTINLNITPIYWGP